MAIAFRSIGSVVSATSGTITGSLPAGFVNNDILLCEVGTGGNPSIGMPAGWTLKATYTNGTNNQLTLWWKRTTGTESAPAISGATQDISAQIACYSGCITSGDPFDVAGSSSSGNTTPASAPSITPSVDGDMIVLVELWTTTGAGTCTFGTPSGSAPTFTIEQQNAFQGATVNVSICLADGLQATAAATGARTSTLSINDNWVAAMLALQPPGGGAAPNAYGDDFGDFPDLLSGSDEAFGADDQAVVLMTYDSAPVGPAQPPLPAQDEVLQDWWENYEDPLVEDSQWSGPILPNAPPQPVEDAWAHDDHEGDDWEWWGADSAPVVADVTVALPLVPDDAWLHEEDPTDEPFGEDSAPVGLNQPPLPVEDGWDWSSPDDFVDDQWEDDGYNVSVANQPPLPVEDAWDWSPEDYTDDPPDDDGSNVQNNNIVVVLPANALEDAWDWTEPDDAWDEPPDDDGSNVQNGNVLPPAIAPPPPTGTLLPGPPPWPSDELSQGMGPYKRPGQVFGEQDPVSPFLTSRDDTEPVSTSTFHVEQREDFTLAVVLAIAYAEGS